MPHSLYLGSGLIQARLREFDKPNTPDSVVEFPPHSESDDDSEEEVKYPKPSYRAKASTKRAGSSEQL